MGRYIPFDRASTLRLLAQLVDTGVLVVADEAGPKGVAAIVITPALWNSGWRIGYGIGLWVDPEFRARGIAWGLVAAGVEAARDRDADLVVIPAGAASGLDPERLAKLYTSQGFELVDHDYVKVL
jgi:GNAT superfamily N-acetyltransferase